MSDESSGQLSRRNFLSGVAASAIGAMVPSDLRCLTAGPPAIPLPGAAPDPFTAAAANANYHKIYRKILGPVIRIGSSNRLEWMEAFDDGSHEYMGFNPETPLEIGEANEFYEMMRWRSWRTREELQRLVAAGGRWIVRANIRKVTFFVVTRKGAQRALDAAEFDPTAWDDDLADELLAGTAEEAAEVSSAEAVQIAARLTEFYSANEQEVIYYEPVRLEHADRDFRLLHLRASEWSPESGNRYDIADLERIFQEGKPLTRSPNHPFTRVPDAYLCLVDFGAGPGIATFESLNTFSWRAGSRAKPDEVFPRDMLQPTGMVLAHIFARPGSSGPYICLGLGHMADGVKGLVARFRVDPNLSRENHQAIGGYGGWELPIKDGEKKPDTQRPEKKSRIRAHLKEIASVTAGWATARRWGDGEMKMVFDNDQASVTYRGDKAYRRHLLYWVPPAEKPVDDREDIEDDEDAAPVARTDQALSDPSAIRVPQKAAIAMLEKYVLGDGILPSSEQWIPLNPLVVENEPDDGHYYLVNAAMETHLLRPRPRAHRTIEIHPQTCIGPTAVLPHEGRVTDMVSNDIDILTTVCEGMLTHWQAADREIVYVVDWAKEGLCAVADGYGDDDDRGPFAYVFEQKIFAFPIGHDDLGNFHKLVPTSDNHLYFRRVTFSQNNQFVMAEYGNNEVFVWNLQTAEQTHHFKTKGDVLNTRFGLDDPYVAYAECDDVVIRALGTEAKPVRIKAKSPAPGGVFFDGVNKLLINGPTIEIWDLESLRCIISIVGFESEPKWFAVQPKQDRFLAIAPAFGAGVIIDMAKGRLVGAIGSADEDIGPMHFSRDGSTLFASADDGVRMWDVETFRQLQVGNDTGSHQ